MDGGPGLSLALRRDAGRLFAVLTDFRLLACHGWAPASPRALARLLRAPGAADAPLHQLLPADVVQALRSRPPAPLALQLQCELDPLPLEALDLGPGLDRLGARFAVTRHLAAAAVEPGVAPPTTRGSLPARLRVRLLGGPGDASALDVLAALLAPHADIDLAPTAPGAPATAGVGPGADLLLCLAPGAPAALAAAPAAAPLLCAWGAAQADATTLLALRARGHAALVAPAPLAQPGMAGTLASWLRGCARGLPPAEALRQAAGAAGWRLYHAGLEPLCRPGRAVLAEAADAGGGASDRDAGPDAPCDDRRLITALSFDLVESTRLLEELGPERYSGLLLDMHARCHAAVEGRGGVVDRRQGDDGSMAWFGLPCALEDAAARALDAALDMQSAMRELPARVRLRIGVATGPVAVHQGLPYGTALHLAARLRAAAEPRQVLLDEATQRLAQGRFAFDPLPGAIAARGLAAPVKAVRLQGPCAPRAPRAVPAGSFVGREAELAALLHRWRRARHGTPVEVLVHGEAGVGKSRLVNELQLRVRAMGARCIEARGLPELQGQAFRAIADALRTTLELAPDAAPALQRRALARALPPAVAGAAPVRLLAQLLGVADAAAPAADDAAAARAREQLLDALADTLLSWAEAAPLLLVVEDLQWVDPSTRELLRRLPAARRRARLMLLCTRRDEESHAAAQPAGGGAHDMALQRLSPAASRRLIHEMVGEALPAAAIERLAQRGDGVPLFLEASARLAVDDAGAAGAALGEIPLSLQALLTARLDRLPRPARALAQAAAVLGREFSEPLLEALAGAPGLPVAIPDLPACRERLERAGILCRTTAAGQCGLAFRHELLRDAAYRSLWQRDRQQLHAAAADTLRTRFPQTESTQPDALAHHLAEAGRHEQALALWERAAKAAAAASANREAIRHACAALASLAQLPASPARDRDELRLQLLLGGRQIAAEGYGAPQVQRIYARAAALVDSVDDAAARIKVQLGLESVYVMRAELRRAAGLACAALRAARAAGDAPSVLQARWALAHVAFHAGHSRRAVALMDGCLAEYRPQRHHRPAAVQDPGVMCLCYSAWALWEMGRGEEAGRRVQRVLALARSLGHRFSLAEACGFAASVAMFRGQTGPGLEWARQAVALCEEAGFTVWLAHARVVQGRLRAMAGDTVAGLVDMRAGLALWTGTGAMITRPFYLAQLALTLIELGRLQEAAPLLAEARALVARTGERYYEAELLRLSGQLALQQGQAAEGVALLHQALALAQRQGKPAFALRAAQALAQQRRHLGREGRPLGPLEQALASPPRNPASAGPGPGHARLAHWRHDDAAREADAQSLARP